METLPVDCSAVDDAYFEEEEEQDIQAWINQVLFSSLAALRGRNPHERIKDPSNPKRLGIRLWDRRLNLDSVPSGWEVFVTSSRPVSSLEISAKVSPDRLYIESWPKLRTVSIKGPREWSDPIVIDVVEDRTVTLDAPEVKLSNLEVQRGNLHLRRPETFDKVVLHSALVEGFGRISALTVSGLVGLPHGCSADTTFLAGEATLVGAAAREDGTIQTAILKKPISLGAVRSNGSASLRLLASAVARSLPSGCEVSIATDVQLRVNEHIENVSFAGEGHVELQSAASASFLDEGGLSLAVGRRASVLDASGALSEIQIGGGRLSGRPSAPLKIGSVTVTDGGELEDVDLSEMQSVGDVMRLNSLDRLSPWMPESLEEIENLAATRPTASPGVRQVFWAYFSELVSQKKGLGASQSAFRYAATHARLLAATRRREKAWLRIYRIVGYGESILLPVLWHLAMSLVILNLVIGGVEMAPAQGLEVEAFPEWANLILIGWRIFILPLSFFRFADDGVVDGWLADVIIPIYRVLGVLMVFFTLAAIRRLTKAE